MTLRTRVALSSAVLCGLVLIAFMAGLGFVAFDNMAEEAEFQLKQLASSIDENGTSAEDRASERRITISGESAGMRLIAVTDSNGDPAFEIDRRTDWPEWGNPEGQALTDEGLTGEFTTIWRDGNPWRLLRSESPAGTRVMAAAEIGEIAFEIRRMLRDALKAVPFALLAIGLAVWWITRKATQPVTELTAAAEEISQGHLDRRIDISPRDNEIARLVATFNRMMDRLERGHLQASRFSADASHELRTPLTILQGQIEEAIVEGETDRETLEGLASEIAHLKSIIEGLLLLSRCDTPGGIGLDASSTDLSAFAEEIAEDGAELAEAAGVAFKSAIGIPPGTLAEIDARLLRLGVMNLVDNAIKYREGSEAPIRFRADIEQGGTSAIFLVENAGPEIPGEDREKLFERFFRRRGAGEKGEGSGLGLSLSRSIAEAHRGAAEYERGEDGFHRFLFGIPIGASGVSAAKPG